MDFMKVFDQTVREIKREVNLKVLKVPEIEQKVLDATDDEPWGPHGTVMAEIAKATKKYSECQLVMDVLWTRLSETGKNWRFVYKALSVIEYLVAHGSERAVDEIVEHTFQISSLASFEYVEPSGKDLGINVRKKAETIVKLLNDKDKIQEVRDKAAANSEKYIGLSSSSITYKSGSSSFSSSNSRKNDRAGGYGYSRDSEAFKDSYEGKGYGKDKYDKATKQKKNPSRYGRKEQDSSASGASKSSTRISKADQYPSVSSQNAESDKYEEFDDFDPRGTSTSKPSAGSNQVELFGQNFVDLLGEPVSLPKDKPTSSDNDPSEVDLFADADFVSAPATQETKSHVPQTNADLFASQPSPAVSATVDFFAAPEPVSQLDNEATKSTTTSNIVDPFATVPMNGFDESDSFGEFTSHADDNQTSPSDGRHGNVNRSSTETKPTPPKKESFQVKSGVWADSLSRGLIDLNITGPKKVDLSDVGIVGGLNYGSEEKDKGSLPSFYTGTGMSMGMGTGTATGMGLGTGTGMGMSMGYGAPSVGSGAGKPGFTSSSTSTSTPNDDFFSSLSSQQYQFGGFQK